MKTNPNRLWWTVLALGWLFDFLFWDKSPGINFPIYVTLCLTAGTWVLWQAGHRPDRRMLWLLLPILFLAVMSFLRLEPLTVFLTISLSLFLMALLALTYLGGRWAWFSLADYVVGFFQLGLSVVSRPITFASDVRKERVENGEPVRRGRVWPVIRGLLIALPVVAIFAALLSSADLVFAQKLDDFIALFRLEKLPEYIFRGVLILIGAYALAGIFLHAATESKNEKLIGEEKPLGLTFLGFTESTIVLGSVVLLFLAFVIVQFQYFFGGDANISIEGYTFSEYARRGFGELVTVAFFSLLLVLGLSTITRREENNQRRVFSGLGISLVGLVIVMLVSAYYRLVLYEMAYGFSRLRTYTHVFMVWLGLLLVVVVVLEIFKHQRAFAVAAVLALLGFVISLSVLNVDAFIVRQNVSRTEAGSELDWQYLVTLSDDAVPALAQVYRDPSRPEGVHEPVGAALVCFSHADLGQQEKARPWQSFHLSHWRAEQTLSGLQDELSGYNVSDRDWSIIVTSPSGEEYSCGGHYVD
jgi:hypothetical protein